MREVVGGLGEEVYDGGLSITAERLGRSGEGGLQQGWIEGKQPGTQTGPVPGMVGLTCIAGCGGKLDRRPQRALEATQVSAQPQPRQELQVCQQLATMRCWAVGRRRSGGPRPGPG